MADNSRGTKRTPSRPNRPGRPNRPSSGINKKTAEVPIKKVKNGK